MIQALLEDGGIPALLQQLGVDGPTLGFGLLNPDGGFHRVMVHAHRSEEARALLEKALTEGEREALGAGADALDQESAGGRKPRSYGVIGAYARAWFWSLCVMAVVFVVFLLNRAV